MKEILIGICCAALIAGSIGYRTGKNSGYVDGAQYGFGLCLDTMSSIINRQVASDTTTTKLVMINPDTVTYYLSRKTALIKR